MLDSHPELAIPGESNFIRSLWDGRRRYWSEGFFHPDRLLEDVVSDPNLATWGVPAEAIREAAPSRPDVGFADVVAAPFRAYATLHGKPRWGDKTPIYVLSMRHLAVLFPRARFVHLIRDGRNVALSYLEMRSFKGGIWEASWRWREWVSAGLRAGAALGSSRYLELRYEDLVDDPPGKLRDVCAFLGLEFVPSMLEYHRTARDRLEVPSDLERFHMNALLPPQRSTRDWREQMTRSDLEVFESVAGSLLTELGYERGLPTLPATTRVRGATRVAMRGIHVRASRAKKHLTRALVTT